MRRSSSSVRSAAFGLIEFPWKWRLADLGKVQKNGRTVFTCFSCGGGSSMGYKLAGYEVLGNCEIDPDMMKVYKANNHPRYSYLMDIRQFLTLPDKEIPAELFDLDVLDGSPPCSVFSMAGNREDAWNVEKTFREGQAKQRLDDLFLVFVEVARKLRPKVVVAENVKGIIAGNAKGWVNQIVRAFGEAGYEVQIFLLNAAKMGVPQKRERVFFVARRKDLGLPKLAMDFNGRQIPFSEVRDEEGKMPSSTSLSGKLIKYRVPTDRCLADVSLRVRRKNAGFTSPINHDDEPVQTITAGGDLFRMCDGRLMSDADIINCQTFPQDYDFLDQNVQYVCGMSVPPVMMANVAHAIDEQIFAGIGK